MRKIAKFLCTVISGMLFFVSCNEEYTTYSGPNYIMFSDTSYVFPVQNNEDYFDVPVAATQAYGYDRTLAVEIDESKSNAIEGVHYNIESNTITIKAGERVANVRVKGYHDNIGLTDSLKIALRLLTKEETKWKLYGSETKVSLQKACPFDINTFTGYCVVVSSYIYSYMTNTDMRLVRSEVDPDNENTIIIKDYFYEGYDVRIKFDDKDILEPLIIMEDQAFGPTSEAFGTIYGDGIIRMYQPQSAVSYFSSCEKFVFQYMTLYVPGMEEGANTVGTFVNIVEWISDDEAEKLMREGY